MHAASRDFPKIVKLLLQNKARPDASGFCVKRSLLMTVVAVYPFLDCLSLCVLGPWLCFCVKRSRGKNVIHTAPP